MCISVVTSKSEIFCMYSSEVEHSTEKCRNANIRRKKQRILAKDRSQRIWLIFAAGEVKESTVCGPLIVLPRTITTQGYFTNFDTTPLGSRHAAGWDVDGWRATGQGRAGIASTAASKPKGLALFQGRWRPTLGVIKVRARGLGHRDRIREQRERRRGTSHPGGVS